LPPELCVFPDIHVEDGITNEGVVEETLHEHIQVAGGAEVLQADQRLQ
jgi:hypothetical protein